MIILIIILAILLLIEIIFSPRLDFINNGKNLLLWYNDAEGRTYIQIY